MIELMHHQLMSCLTGKVNEILDNNQTYDPSVNFGNHRSEHKFLHYAFENGMNSVAVSFKAMPVMPLPFPTKNTIYSLLKEQRIEGLRISILMTLNEVIYVHK